MSASANAAAALAVQFVTCAAVLYLHGRSCPLIPCTAEEKEVAEKRKVKLDKKKERIADAAVKGVAAPKRLKRKATKGVRIKKHVVVRVREEADTLWVYVGAAAAREGSVPPATWAAQPLLTAPHDAFIVFCPISACALPHTRLLPNSPVWHHSQGIKVTDAESKKKIKEVLAAEEAMKSMLMDMDGGPAAAEEQAAKQRQKPSKSKVGIGGGARVKASGIKVKAAAGGKGDKGGKAAKAAKKPAAMALD